MNNNIHRTLTTVAAAIAFTLGSSLNLSAQQDYSDVIKTSKTASVNDDGSVTLTLETYVTGTEITTIKQTPLNAVLVLDVSGSMDNDLAQEYSFSQKNSQAYDYFDLEGFFGIGGSSLYYKHTDGKYYRVFGEKVQTGSIFGVPTTYKYAAKVIIDNAEYYFSNNGGITQTSTYVTTALTTIWTGVLYQRNVTKSVSRLSALQTSVKNFVQEVASNNPDNQIAIVTYSANATTKVSLTKLDATGVAAINSAIDNLSASGATRADYGMEKAVTEVKKMTAANNGGEDPTKLVVMFTDGVPTDISSFSNSVAGAAVDYSKTCKDQGANVYSIGLIDELDNSKVYRYLNYLSSNYPSAYCSTKGDFSTVVPGSASTGDEKDKYFKTVDNADALDDVFGEIAEEHSGGSAIQLESSDIKLEDVISDDFTLPEGVDASNIANNVKFYVAPCTGVNASGDRSFGTKVSLPTSEIPIPSISLADGNKISVTGFDFCKYWCGKEIQANNTVTYHGYKLIFTFDVELKPTSDGGSTKTNTDDSGVYIKDQQSSEFSKEVGYDVNGIYIISTKQLLNVRVAGLKANETAFFDVTCNYSTPKTIRVAVTAGSDGTGVTSLYVDTYGNDVNTPYTFMVQEASDWTWAYGEPVISGNSGDGMTDNTKALYSVGSMSSTTTKYYPDFIFTFSNPDTTILHGEDASGNNIYR